MRRFAEGGETLVDEARDREFLRKNHETRFPRCEKRHPSNERGHNADQKLAQQDAALTSCARTSRCKSPLNAAQKRKDNRAIGQERI